MRFSFISSAARPRATAVDMPLNGGIHNRLLPVSAEARDVEADQEFAGESSSPFDVPELRRGRTVNGCGATVLAVEAVVRGRAALEMKLKRIRNDIDLRNDLLSAAGTVADRECELPDLSFERDPAVH